MEPAPLVCSLRFFNVCSTEPRKPEPLNIYSLIATFDLHTTATLSGPDAFTYTSGTFLSGFCLQSLGDSSLTKEQRLLIYLQLRGPQGDVHVHAHLHRGGRCGSQQFGAISHVQLLSLKKKYTVMKDRLRDELCNQ